MLQATGRTVIMTTHLLHGLWTPDHGLALWVEQVEGHKIVLPEQVPTGTFPPIVEAELAAKSFRHRLHATLQTPRGRMVELPIPVGVFTPEQAVSFFARVAFLDGASPAATEQQRTALAPDFMWLLRMYRGLEQFVRAGRVLLRCAWRDNEWWPQWQLATGMGENAWVAEMVAATPGVVSANGGSRTAELMAEELPHWIASSLLEGLRDAPRPSPWHEFSSSLLHSRPLRRGGPGLVSKLNDWKNSASTMGLELVVIVEEPFEHLPLHNVSPDLIEASDGFEVPGVTTWDEPVWPVRIRVRRGVDAPYPVRLAQWDEAAQEQLRKIHAALFKRSPVMQSNVGAVPIVIANYDDNLGDWDLFFSTEEIVQFVSKDVTTLKTAGFQVMLPKSWGSYEPHLTVNTTESGEVSAAGSKLGLEQLVEYNWQLSLGDIELSASEMQELVNSKAGLVKLRGEWMMADAAALRHISDYMAEIAKASESRLRAELDSAKQRADHAKAQQEPGWEELVQQAQKLQEEFDNRHVGVGQVTLAELRQIALEATAKTPVEFTGSQWHTSLLGGDIAPAPERIDIPETVHAQLREYQRRGVDWLYWMSRNNLGAVLADDMGLGKTLQLLALVAVERAAREDAAEESAKPTLVVCPTSVVGNWAAEAKKFVPSFNVLVQYGSQRKHDEEFAAAAKEADLVITSYGVVTRDYEAFGSVDWERVVLDEAQQIKNSTTRASKAVRSIPSRHRLALTGTPVENRLAELWSIVDFCNPGMLGSASFFRNHFATAIERHQDEEVAEKLRSLTAPFILRRVKTDPDIIDDLPDKNEDIVTVHMTTEQAALYKALVDDIQQQLENAEGMAKRGLVLATITKIKQICNHPAHFLGDGSSITLQGKHRSGKMEALVGIVDGAIERRERVLVFTQYKAFGDLIQPYLSERYGVDIPFLHGGISKTGRDAMVQKFQAEDGPPTMILSLKAGGTGLNLTAASIVVHMDRWWNPAVENQATDRAYRIGQRKNVHVYKMVTEGTMEESIQDIIDGKLQLAGAVIGQGEGWITELSPEQLAQLMSYRGKE